MRSCFVRAGRYFSQESRYEPIGIQSYTAGASDSTPYAGGDDGPLVPSATWTGFFHDSGSPMVSRRAFVLSSFAYFGWTNIVLQVQINVSTLTGD